MAEKMRRVDRAKQFLPFNSLRGFYDLVRIKEKIITPRRELTSDELEKLSFRYNQLEKGKMAKITYYEIDGYVKLEGMIAKIDNINREITIVDKVIKLDDIVEVESDGIIDL